MSKVVAIGGGNYHNDEIFSIFERIVEMSGKKNPSVIFLPTAGFDDINGDEPIADAFRRLGCNFDILFLTDKKLSIEDIRNTIFSADIIYAGGGNLKFLMDTLKETGANDILREAAKNDIVLSGFSSGAMCWFDSGYDDCGENHEFMFVDCLGLFPYCYCPHFISDYWRSFENAVTQCKVSGLGVEDGAALIFDGENFETICGNDGGEVFYFDKDKNFEKINITEKAHEFLK
ncbi:MAG: Type 1 glutamine amidotransferase-like domain-containing protein [Clostridia bacterium]|nr:Type 1 glutamine amidotransferase-like domain-containing protein [Clostridia bacterium]MBQ7046583.1 Type 1 glutamine amidotransferase-like domain-containing protein [Oscillospiraceae bacterium]